MAFLEYLWCISCSYRHPSIDLSQYLADRVISPSYKGSQRMSSKRQFVPKCAQRGSPGYPLCSVVSEPSYYLPASRRHWNARLQYGLRRALGTVPRGADLHCTHPAYLVKNSMHYLLALEPSERTRTLALPLYKGETEAAQNCQN